MTKHDVLKKYFGYQSFRGGQEELIDCVLEGRDVLGIMPTGAGKSICFQLPAMMSQGITLVISPLISLMKDQVGALIQAGIPAAFLNSTLTPRQISLALENAAGGKYKLIYVAPERLGTADFSDFARNTHISMVTVDEAHCISQWGQDFRPSYGQIPQFIDSLPQRPVVSAFTATATARVREDIEKLLNLREPKILVSGFDRENLYFEVQSPKNKMKALTDFLNIRSSKSGIIYCSTRKNVEQVCESLNKMGFSAARYHAGLSDSERRTNQDDFLYDKVQIMVATNAFGMGIDKSNVSFVVHFNMPKDIESYYQEAGRAGRDGSEADCLMLYSGQDVVMNRWLIENSGDTVYKDEETEELLKEQERRRLREMTFYSTTNGCLRGYILKYFGETHSGYCGKCGNCKTKFETVDITLDAQRIISCIARMRERFGASLVVDVLRAAENSRIDELGLREISTYGIMRDKTTGTIRSIMDFLIQNGYLVRSDGQYQILTLSPTARDVLCGKTKLEMKLVRQDGKKEKQLHTDISGREELYGSLKKLRQEIARGQSVPSYVVFSDSSLSDMCVNLPQTQEDFLKIQGVGETRLKRYGESFMEIIREFCEKTGLSGNVPKSRGNAKKGRSVKTTVLPSTELLSKIQAQDSPVSVSDIVKKINEYTQAQGATGLTAVRVGEWLVFKGYLQVNEDKGRKEPTKSGAELGITTQERRGQAGVYAVNLYSKEAQQMIISHTCEILVYQKIKKHD